MIILLTLLINKNATKTFKWEMQTYIITVITQLPQIALINDDLLTHVHIYITHTLLNDNNTKCLGKQRT